MAEIEIISDTFSSSSGETSSSKRNNGAWKGKGVQKSRAQLVFNRRDKSRKEYVPKDRSRDRPSNPGEADPGGAHSSSSAEHAASDDRVKEGVRKNDGHGGYRGGRGNGGNSGSRRFHHRDSTSELAAQLIDQVAKTKGAEDALKEFKKDIAEKKADLEQEKKDAEKKGMHLDFVNPEVKMELDIKWNTKVNYYVRYFVAGLFLSMLLNFLLFWFGPAPWWSLLILFILITCPYLGFVYYVYVNRESRIYNTRKWVKPSHSDRRSDSIAVGDLKHKEALYAISEYYSGPHKTARKLYVSLELFAQLTTFNNFPLNSTPAAVFERLNWSAARFQSVNVDRYLTCENIDITADTVIAAYGWYLQRMEKLLSPFPSTPDLL